MKTACGGCGCFGRERNNTAVELLDGTLIRAQLRIEHGQRLHSFEVPQEVDSTNTRLLSASPPPFGSADVCIAESQRAGRGRRGRPWVSPPGASIALSMGWAFRQTRRDLPALSLAAGVAVARALTRTGACDVMLKWPNDIWFRDRKIGGVLLESRTDAGGPAFVVIGIGINVTLSAKARGELEQGGVRAGALADACQSLPSRNQVAGAILDELFGMLMLFERDGLAPFLAPWADLDALRDRPSRVLLGERWIAGRARGVDDEGALLLEVDGQVQKFNSGEVSLRLEGEAA
jgi:BirA family transcriptional regulator, biotin operon repressor / biotin---[acetyl-CoA-carboxylase] ligase